MANSGSQKQISFDLAKNHSNDTIRKTQPKPTMTSAGLWRATALSTGSPPYMSPWTS